MKNKCNYITFFNEFNITIDKRLCLIPVYNGFFFTKNYRKHLHQTIEKFKHDLFYELPINPVGNEEAFLINLYRELSQKHSVLQTSKKKKISNNYYSIRIPFISFKLSILNKLSTRRIVFMHYKQISTLKHALISIEKAADSFGITIKNSKIPNKIDSDFGWDGGKIGLIQVLKSMFKSGILIHGRLSENQAIIEIAKLLNISLSRSNFSSLSRAINYNNNDYQPEIFERIKKGYQMTVYEKVENQEKRKK